MHRDIKPSNVIYVQGRPKLADIGLVTNADLTCSYVGTEGFVPPEGPGTPQADIYSLGKVLYEAATGRDRQDFPELPTQLGPNEQQELGLLELNEVILRACDPDVKRRYSNTETMRGDLKLLQKGKSVARLHATERRLAKLKRYSLVGATITTLMVIVLLWQVSEAQKFRQLSTQNLVLAEENKQKADESRARLNQLQLANGLWAMEEADFNQALLWFSETLKNTDGDSQSQTAQRYRLGILLQYSSKLLVLDNHGGNPRILRVSTDAKRITYLSKEEAGMRIKALDATTGQALFTLTETNAYHADISSDGRWILTVHYANGLRQEIPIVYGKDVRDWWHTKDEPLETTHSQIAWQGSNEAVKKEGHTLRLFKSTWENEFPEVEIATLDFIAYQHKPAPFLIAITVE